MFDDSYDGTLRALEQSASRLGFSDFDLVHIHDVDQSTHGEAYERIFDRAMDGAYSALDDLRSAGHIRAIGLGVNESSAATRFLRAGRFDAVMIAGHYTLLDNDALDELLPEAEQRGTAVVAAAIFNSGVLAAGRNLGSATYNYRPIPAAIAERVSRLADICARHAVPIQAVALQFPLRHPSVAAIIVGAIEVDHIAANVRWAKLPIPNALLG